MSEKDKPADTPPAENVAQQPAREETGSGASLPRQAGEAEPKKPDRVQLLIEKRAARTPQGPQKGEAPVSTRVPSLEKEQTYGFGKRIDAFDAEMEHELEEALAGFSDQDLLGKEERPGRKPATPESSKKKGRVYSVRGQDVFIELPGGRTQGFLPAEQFPEGVPAPGTEVEVHIEGFDNANGLLILSRLGAAVSVDWSSVAVGQIVEARVTGTNKGGLEVQVNNIRGFMPISQIELFRVEDIAPYVNQRLRCLVVDVEPMMNNLVVSRRALLEKEREENKELLWQTLEEGQVREGVVRNVREFGAFVDLGGVDGLVPVSEISWTRTDDATKVLQPGQPLKVKVLRLDREKKKITLGLRQLTASPWDTVLEKYPPGEVMTGKVTRIAQFGAFVELEPGLEGLIHISELAPQRVWRVTNVVQVDQMVQVKVLNVDAAQRRISLSLKEALPKEEAPKSEDEEEEGTPAEPVKQRKRNFDLRRRPGQQVIPIPEDSRASQVSQARLGGTIVAARFQRAGKITAR